MASSLHNYVVAVLLLAIIRFEATSGSSDHYHHHHHHKQHHLKSLHFSLFQHDTTNKTGYTIVNGIEGTFGTLYVFRDPLTVTANISSKQVGISEGTSITSSFDGLHSLSIAKLSLNLKHHKGSVSVVGGIHNIKPSDQPVVGGTGDFKFVQGYVTSFTVDLKGLTVYKIEFHLYFPPYAIHAS